MMKRKTPEKKKAEPMNLEEALWWLEILESNLLDADYSPRGDDETHFKIAALRLMIERTEKLEDAFNRLDKLRDEIGKAIAVVL